MCSLPGRSSSIRNGSASFRFLSVLGGAWVSLSDGLSGVMHVNSRPNKEAGSCDGVNGPSVFGWSACARGLFLGLLSTVSLMHVRL